MSCKCVNMPNLHRLIYVTLFNDCDISPVTHPEIHTMETGTPLNDVTSGGNEESECADLNVIAMHVSLHYTHACDTSRLVFLHIE